MEMMDRKTMLTRIQELEFAAVELNLFLDTHPENQQALADFNMITEQLINMKNAYEMMFGPLCNFGSSPSRYPWKWIDEPWPWEEVD